jgi:DNA-directed RNA polymerase subunit RPC12/RpoP
MADDQDSAVKIGPDDLVFNCPRCGKSLTIDHRGAGLMVPCPDCSSQVMVPNPKGVPVEEELTSEEATDSLNLLVDRIRELEKAHALDAVRIEKISEQLVLIQAAVDRIVDIIQDARGGGAESDEA